MARKTAFERLQENHDNLTDQHEKALEEIEGLNKRISELEGDLSQETTRADNAEHSLDTVRRNLQAANTTISKLKNHFNNVVNNFS